MAKKQSTKAADLQKVPMLTVDMPRAVRETLQHCTTLQRRFVVAYCGVARGNGTLAAKLAGVNGTYAAIASTASNLLKEPRTRAAIEAWMIAYALTGAEVTAALGDLAQANLGPFVQVGKDGSLTVKVADDAVWEAHKAWIKAVECHPETGRVTRLILHDRVAALRELAKILKLYSDAPQINLTLFLQRLSDDELLTQLEAARVALRGVQAPSGN